jgi:hypothetical protein
MLTIMRVAVTGYGKIRFTITSRFAQPGQEIVGVNTNAATVDIVNHGREPFTYKTEPDERLHELILADFIAHKRPWRKFTSYDLRQSDKCLPSYRGARGRRYALDHFTHRYLIMHFPEPLGDPVAPVSQN